MLDQDDVFRSGEGDNWFLRNLAHLSAAVDEDKVAQTVRRLAETEQITSICELGCANGWRLALLNDQMGPLGRVAGADISEKAIKDGRQRWPDLELKVGSTDIPNLGGLFDVVILSFVLHWVARDRLARTVAAVDMLVKEGGHVVLADFLPDQPCKRPYHHRQDVELFTYKQDYRTCFTGLQLYELTESEIFSHGGQATVDEQDRAVCALLRKSSNRYALV